MTRRLMGLAGVASMICFAGSVPSAPVQTPGAAAEDPSVKGLVSGNVDFSFKLLRLLADGKPKDNIFISPISIGIGLCMELNGAGGATRTDIAAAVGLGGLSRDEANTANRTVLDSLASADPQATVLIADSLWLDRRFRVSPRFQSVCAEYYRASTTCLDFADPSSARKVNTWARIATLGRVADIVAPGELSGAAAVLVNAIYFKCGWSIAFRKADTRDAPFTLGAGRTKIVPLMHVDSRFRYADSPDFQAVELPYGKGRLSFVIILPHESVSIAAVLQELNGEQWLGLQSRMDRFKDVALYLPRFKAKYKVHLDEPLKAIGMASAFSPDADFSDMSPDPTQISQVIHQANLDVDEKGTVAAAATTLETAWLGRRKPITVRVDHPFIALIRDSVTGALLFAGVINDPD